MANFLAETSSLGLLETEGFIAELVKGLKACEQRILIQLMTFDGDAAGTLVADSLIDAARRGVSVRVLIDSFVEKAVSDTPASKPEVAAELAATNAMFERLRDEGVEVKFTHPLGPAGIFMLVRNHKKLFVLDDIAYVGGVNVSDHNFAWRDFMVAVKPHTLVETLVADFDDTWQGGRQNVEVTPKVDPPDLPVTILTNDKIEAVFDRLVVEATREVLLASPYADDIGLCRLLERSKAPVRRVILVPESNVLAFRLLSPYIHRRLSKAGVALSSYDRFSHAKFLLVDDSALLVGSANFGRHSFWCNQELCLLINDPVFIAEFKKAMTADTIDYRPRASKRRLALGLGMNYFFHGLSMTMGRTVARWVPSLSRR